MRGTEISTKLKEWLTTLVIILPTIPITKADTGASSHCLTPQHRKALHGMTTLSHGPIATLLDNNTIQASHQGKLDIISLLTNATKALIFHHLQNKSLLPIG